ncbi:hypothetical protein ATE92_2532 [Ulvibacter sp. MAR_2010_11]|uniref:hypothetical protein n=1 Tax=Ulvibacter sp. MAR_2010_11 TaxID=1250229 RepID=UPI000C2B5801|nr:hypothetical protein [Ulvibacter sp. MAR_2010_11]PKA84345.1 hypothetical protein ATE92_2532 [Ulvibacter sp. MAR_2010_11]
MKKVALLMTLALLVIYGCSRDTDSISESDTQNLVMKANNGPSANGHGTLQLADIPVGGDDGKRQFTFHAREKKNGDVSGSGVLKYTGGGTDVRFDIDCLRVDGNTANMSGLVTQNSSDPSLEGTYHYFSVEDNGEGSGSSPDQITLFYSGYSESYCLDDNPFPLYSIVGGNVQVRE